MENKILLGGISGSLRKGSYNTMLLKLAASLLPENVEIKFISIADIPLYNGDNDLPIANERPASVEKFRAEIAGCNGLLIVTPEYNHSIPGVLKNALDWASRGKDTPLYGKPVAVMGASNGMIGTARSQIALYPLLHTLNMKYSAQPEILVGMAQNKFDENGNFNDEVGKDFIRKNLMNLIELID